MGRSRNGGVVDPSLCSSPWVRFGPQEAAEPASVWLLEGVELMYHQPLLLYGPSSACLLIAEGQRQTLVLVLLCMRSASKLVVLNFPNAVVL